MVYKLTTMLFLWALLSMLGLNAGCGGCSAKKDLTGPKAGSDEADSYLLSEKMLFDGAKTFSYNHVISLTKLEQDRQAVTVERVDVVGDHGKLHLKKKIDDQHFFELWHENNDYLVKNRLGPWHSGMENKPMYASLIDDGLNALSWTLEQFSLKKLLTRQKDNGSKMIVFVIEDKTIPPDAPFLVNMPHEANFKASLSRVKARLEIDAATKLPISSRFSIEIGSEDKKTIKLEAEIMLAQNQLKEALTKPLVADSGPLLYPVNIAPRFIDLMKHEQGDEK
jgi:hypothetical protein